MATSIPSEFQRYEFTEDEERQAALLPELTLQSIRNKLALAMTDRATLSFDPTLPNAAIVFTQREAALMGEINAYRVIIAAHEEAVVFLTNPANQE